MGLRRRLLLVAILATGIASSIATAQEMCGGIAGAQCTDVGEFCELRDGECCCDFVGKCATIPTACPNIFDPVCGCDGHTYQNRCEAHRNSVSVNHVGPCAGDVCGGITGIECTEPNEFCELPDGQCCCDIVGACTLIPQGCPAIFDPVCGCDGHTYSSRCEAQRNSVSVDHAGPCAAGPEVTGVLFTGQDEMMWDPMPGALAYNVYIDRGPNTTDTPGFHGLCLHSPLPGPRVLLEIDPPSNVLYSFEVTAMYESGEGALGSPSPGSPRRAVIPCTCTLPADFGPCDGVCPRWFFNYLAGGCEEFIWGCCGGNANNFLTEDVCAATCPM
jgi:Kunitz/Bovine pancreatic trypsin inhibitor domain/Kazal-type serine protease inhibitor domain